MQCAFLSRNFSLHHVQWTFLLLYQASVSLTMWDLFFVSQFEGVSKVYIKRFQNTCYFSLYVKLWVTAQRLVSHISPSRKLAKKKTKNIGFLWHGICMVISQHMLEFGDTYIQTENVQMLNCAWHYLKLSVEMIVVSYFRIRLYK